MQLWNWQQQDWPEFTYDSTALAALEQAFLYKAGFLLGVYQHATTQDQPYIVVDMLSEEAIKTSEIEGEYLSRDSVQSSIKRDFGLDTTTTKIPAAEQGIADMMVNLYQTFSGNLSDRCLFDWHTMLTNGRDDLRAIGTYRTHPEAMQVVSGYLHERTVHFEAPPSAQIPAEMKAFIAWFNQSRTSMPPLTRAGIAHLYFVCIHPFEDGNGRIARAIATKALSQSVAQPLLLSLSTSIQHKRKEYYSTLERNNKQLDITDWLIYFANTVLQAQEYTQATLEFLLAKTKLYDRARNHMNPRQEKALERVLRTGVAGFEGGLSAKKYMAITQASASTATRDLQYLVDKKILRRTGERKSTRYYPNL